MKWASLPSAYKNVILRDSVRTGRNFSPARNVLSITAPSSTRFSFVRTKAPPLPGLTCWNSTIRKTLPSTSTCMPFLNWLVLTTAAEVSRASLATADKLCFMSAHRQHAHLDAPLETVWGLVGSPNRYPEWWPRVIEVRG